MLSFGTVTVLLVDADRRFRGAFESMCKFPKIKFCNIAHSNHKVDSVKKYHQLQKKTQATARQHGVIHDVFIQNDKTSQYTWNSAPINDTNVMRSVAAVGREFIFPLDIELLLTTNLNPNNTQLLFKYLLDVFTNPQFSISVLKI